MIDLAALHNTAWAVEPEALEAALVEARARVADGTFEARAGLLASSRTTERPYTLNDGVADISVTGLLSRRPSLFTALFGGATYSGITDALGAAARAPDVREARLVFDSVGGEVAGVAELAAAIRAFSKPITAHIAGHCASAAYWLASACDRITSSPTGQAGSIGVVATVPRRDDDGTIDFVSSSSPNKVLDPATDNGAARIQRRVDELAEVFVAAVATGRGITEAEVVERFGAGDIFVAARALAVGMVDEIIDAPAPASASTQTSAPVFAAASLPAGGRMTTGAPPMTIEELQAQVAAKNAEIAEVLARAESLEGRAQALAARAQETEAERDRAVEAAKRMEMQARAAARDAAITKLLKGETGNGRGVAPSHRRHLERDYDDEVDAIFAACAGKGMDVAELPLALDELRTRAAAAGVDLDALEDRCHFTRDWKSGAQATVPLGRRSGHGKADEQPELAALAATDWKQAEEAYLGQLKARAADNKTLLSVELRADREANAPDYVAVYGRG